MCLWNSLLHVVMVELLQEEPLEFSASGWDVSDLELPATRCDGGAAYHRM